MAIDIRTAPAPLEVVTPIKPSEAIRLGCLIAPVQAFEHYGTGKEACAMGAMNLGWGRAQGEWVSEEMLPDPYNPCPVTNCSGFAEIRHLNDDHKFSREWIADWLGGLGW